MRVLLLWVQTGLRRRWWIGQKMHNRPACKYAMKMRIGKVRIGVCAQSLRDVSKAFVAAGQAIQRFSAALDGFGESHVSDTLTIRSADAGSVFGRDSFAPNDTYAYVQRREGRAGE